MLQKLNMKNPRKDFTYRSRLKKVDDRSDDVRRSRASGNRLRASGNRSRASGNRSPLS